MENPFSVFAGLLGVVLFTAAANGQTPASSQPSPTASARARLIDAGTLLTKEEVAGVQGCAITNAESSAGQSGQFSLTQCYYTAAEPDRSVSLALMQTAPGDPAHHTAKQGWHETFDRYAKPDNDDKEEEEREKREEAEKKTAAPKAQAHDEEERETEHENPPLRIDNLGDAAYWTSNQIGGVLYVLKGEMFIRISVGGRDKPDDKLAKSKALAVKALARM